jgi:mannan endo-1,4-beta-mannosidase
MKARLPLAGAAALGLLAATLAGAVLPAPAQAQTGGFHISGTDLLDANGNPFVFRGVAVPHVWFPQQFQMFGDAAGLGANAVRVVLGSGHQWGPNSPSDVANVVDECKQHSLVCMLEVHDATGFGEQQTAVSINQVVDDYWSDPALVSALQGEEAFVLINIANEPRGNNNAAAWVTETIGAIQDMRAAGYDHTLVVDAPNWGQDWQFVMRDNAPQIAAADPQDNILFSIHMYEVFGSASTVVNYLDAFAQLGLPLMVGEFGHMHNGQNVDEDTIMAEAQARGVGWVAWSWSGNSGGAEFLDLTNGFNPDSPTTWGQRVFNGADGIGQTAACATVFPDCDGPPPDDDPPAAPTGLAVTGSTTTSVSLSWNPSAGADSYQLARAPGTSGGSFTPVGTTTATTLTDPGLTPATTYRYQVTASNPAGSSPPSATLTVTTPPSGGGGGGCQITYQAANWGGHPGFTATVTVTNTSTTTITGWTAGLTYTAGQDVEEPGWNGTTTQSGAQVSTLNAAWNGTLAPNTSTSYGFNALATAIGNNPNPTGLTCTTG